MSEFIRPVGPVDIVVIGFPDAKFDGSIAPAIADLVAAGTVRILDLVLVNKDLDGVVTLIEITDLDGDGQNDLLAIRVDIPGMLSEEDVNASAEGLPPGSAVAMIAWENTWAINAAMAIRSAGGMLLAHERISVEDVNAVLDAADDLS